MYQYRLERCPENCTSSHNHSDVFSRQGEKDPPYFIMDSQINACELKWKLASDMIKYNQSVDLAIINLSTQSIQKDYSLLSYDCIEAVTLEFEERIQASNRKCLDDLFKYLQQAANLKALSFCFQNKNADSEQSILGTNFQAVKGSFANLEQLSFKLFDTDIQEFELQPLELSLIDPTKDKGNLKFFEFKCFVSHASNEAIYLAISRIFGYNQDSIMSVNFTVYNSGDSKCHPLVILGESFSKMRNLNEIQFDIIGFTDTYDLNKLVDGISAGYQNNTSPSESQSIRLNLSKSLVTDGSKIGSCLINFSNVKLHSYLSISAAEEIGKALRNSQKLQYLELASSTVELGHLLVQILSSPGFLKDLNVQFEGNNLKILPEQLTNFKSIKSVETLTVLIDETDLLSLTDFIDVFSETETINKLLHLKLTLVSFNGKASQISELLEKISKITSLQSLSISIKKIKLMDEVTPEDLYLPLQSLRDLDIISIFFPSQFEKQQKEKFFMKLVSGLICHPRVRAVKISKFLYLSMIQKIANKFQFEFESTMANTIAFYKVLSSFLEFHPTRHLEDFYL